MPKKSASKRRPASARKSEKPTTQPATKLGKVLRSAREARGLTVERAAKACYCSARRWNSIERGDDDDLSLALAMTMAKTLRISLHDILNAM